MDRSKIRRPVVAGQFYPSSSERLTEEIESLIDKDTEKSDVIACMLPHAGYMYSGSVAAKTLSKINLKNKIILIGPNHTGCGPDFSIMTEGIWRTPLGEVEIDSELANKILEGSKYLCADTLAHMHEHSLEVELPFLQYFEPNLKIVPIIILPEDINKLKEVGQNIASAIKESNLKDSVLIIASSDMTHYESQLQAQKKDQEAIKAILELNEDDLLKKVEELNISMCGYAPMIVTLAAAKLLGASSAELIKYQTSADVTGDTSEVVGYAGITIF